MVGITESEDWVEFQGRPYRVVRYGSTLVLEDFPDVPTGRVVVISPRYSTYSDSTMSASSLECITTCSHRFSEFLNDSQRIQEKDFWRDEAEWGGRRIPKRVRPTCRIHLARFTFVKRTEPRWRRGRWKAKS